MNDILLSICIPTYNRPKYLRACLVSAFKNISADNLAKIEVVISDNSDNEATKLVADEFRNRGSHVNYIKNEINIGGPRNLLQALNAGQGKYLWLCGDDDLIISGKINLIIDKLNLDDYSGVILNFAQGENSNPEILMLDNCLSLKDDKVFYGREDLFSGKDFINFFALNFMSALIINKDDFKNIYSQATAFSDTCYPQAYMFLLIAALDKTVLRISDPCVIWRSPDKSRRYDTWQKDEGHIFNQYIDYVRYAGEIGFRYDRKYLEESIKFKSINLFYFKNNNWKNKFKASLAEMNLDKAVFKLIHFFRYLRYILRKR